MTQRENAKALIGRRKPERVGYFDTFWPDLVEKWRSEGHLTKVDPETGREVCLDPSDTFGADVVGVGGWLDNQPLRGYSEVLQETEQWRIVRNGAGATLRWWKHRSGTPEHVDFRMTSREVWERDYRQHLLEVDDERLHLDRVKPLCEEWRDRNKLTVFGDMFLWESLRQSAGDVCMLEALMLNPDWVHDFNRVYTDFYKAHYGRLIELCGVPDAVMLYDDLGYKNGLFCSPDTLRELYLPYYAEMVDFLHKQGAFVILHSCGGIEAALPMIVEAGFDALNPMEVKAGCSVVRFAEKYGDRLAFLGGLDVRILESGDRALIKNEVTSFMEDMKARGARFFFGSDHSCSTYVDYDDYQYALQVYREHMLY